MSELRLGAETASLIRPPDFLTGVPAFLVPVPGPLHPLRGCLSSPSFGSEPLLSFASGPLPAIVPEMRGFRKQVFVFLLF